MASRTAVTLERVQCRVSPTLPDHNSSMNVRRMWDGGPLRQFSETQASGHYIRYSGRFLTGFAGAYVCDRCRRPCGGVYLTYLSETGQEWLCGGCKNQKQRCGGSEK
jgi:hypothetical protein